MQSLSIPFTLISLFELLETITKVFYIFFRLPTSHGKDNIHLVPSDDVPWITECKWCHIRMEGRAFGDALLNLELKLEVWDSPNSAGVMIDAVRCAKIVMDRGIGDQLTPLINL
jgi:myo-inositol-1-phosphate synthase